MHSDDIWPRSLDLIRQEVGENIFDLWFSPIRLLQIKEGTAVLEVPNRFFKEWIEDYHPTLVTDALERVTSTRLGVRYRVSGNEDAALKRADARMRSRKSKLARKGIYLNPRYTFESFVTGPSNQFAHAAAMAVSETPGRVYNPLFIYGGVGLGKTHLITAVGNRVVDRSQEVNVLYVSAEQFTNEVVSSFRHGKTEELKSKYRNLDMILLDDVQFVENKAATQEELFHTLNVLYEKQKQIVLSSDRPPKEMKQMTDRLRSRFGMGLIADIQPPEVETKMAIIQKKAEQDRLALGEDVVSYIASRVKSNVRDIEGCLIRLGAHSSLTGQPVTLAMAKTLLRDFIQEDDRPLSVEGIARTVAEYFGLKVADLKAKKRTKDIALPRQIAMHLARELTECSLSEIGKHLGGKDHATVIYACKQVEARSARDENFSRMVQTLRNKLQP
ncbi:MAG: chromosomal replication initiator protein DnaA [Nitrospirota bacterium]|jgi:chromosomal replication initiator protein